MNRYWLGITAGAVGVFGLGLTGISLGKKGLAELKTAVAERVEPFRKPLGALRFRLDGKRVGRVEAVEVRSEGTWDENAVRLTVALDDGVMTDRIEGCDIVGDRFEDARDDARFRCASGAEIGDGDLAPIGVVRFEPAGLERPLYIPQRSRRQLERANIKSLTASLRSENGEAVDGSARFDVGGHRGERHRGIVQIHAGDGRASIDIRDESGRELFRLRADDHGVSLDARDQRGHELIKLLAGSAGVSLKIDP
jgi:hypothetical protein